MLSLTLTASLHDRSRRVDICQGCRIVGSRGHVGSPHQLARAEGVRAGKGKSYNYVRAANA